LNGNAFASLLHFNLRVFGVAANEMRTRRPSD
jgi:hypothetical protein